MQRPDFKKARQQMTGGMPTGEYHMADMEFSIERKEPEPAMLYFTSFADFERWHDEQNKE